MSKDKGTGKRLYSVRGASTKAKKKASKAGGGKKSKPGASHVTFCPTCFELTGRQGDAIAVDASTRFISCKQGHEWEIV